MGMGMKMLKAWHKNEGITVKQAVEKSVKDDLECITECCRVPISLCNEYYRQKNDNTTLVKAHFKLMGIKGGKNTHHINCKYNTKGQLEIIARDSDGVLTSLEEGKNTFRLNLITSSLRNTGISKGKSEGFLSEGQSSKTTKKYINEGKITPYLSTVHRIMKLRSEIENNKELNNIVKLNFKGKNIPWSKFYFEKQDYRRCYDYLTKGEVTHPICIEGTIKDTLQEPTDRFKFYTMRLSSPYIEESDKDGTKRIPSVSIKLNNLKDVNFIKSELEKGKRNIVFYSDIKTHQGSYNNSVVEMLYINGEIHHSRQYYMFE